MNYVISYSCPLSEFPIPKDDKEYPYFGRKEIFAWLNQLRREFPLKNFAIMLHEESKTWNTVLFYEDNEDAQQEVFATIDELPYCWDDKAREELGPEYFDYIRRLRCPQDYPATTEEKDSEQKSSTNTQVNTTKQ